MMIYQKSILFLISGFILNFTAIENSAFAESITDHWGNLHAKLDEALILLAEKPTLPESTWNPFKEDKQSIDCKINELLDEAVDILNISGRMEKEQ